jgi:hypothetical protein
MVSDTVAPPPAPDEPTPDGSPAVVRWEGLSSTRLRTALRHLVAGLVVTVGLAVAALLGLVAYGSVTGGRPAVLVLLVTMLLVGGPFSLLYLVAVRREIDVGEFLPVEGLRPRYVLLAAPFGVVVLGLGTQFPLLFFALLLGLPLLYGFAAAREADGAVDVETGELVSEGGSTASPGPKDVRTLRSHSLLRLGDVCLVRLRYRGPTSLQRPSLLVVPAAAAPRVDAALSAVETRDYGVEASGASRAARAVLAGFGLLFVGVAGGVFALGFDASSNPGAVLYAAVLMAFFGGLFFVVAWLS